MRSKWYILFAMLIMVGMLLAACQPAATTEAPSTGDTGSEPEPTAVPPTEVPMELPSLRINLGTYPDLLDPQKSSFVNEIAHLKLVYEGLTKLDGDLNTIPGAAEKWEYNADATEITFTLREGLTYSDGTLLNAARYEYSLLRNINPATAGEYAAITDDIKGAAAWRTSEMDDTLKDGVAVKAYKSDGTTACDGYEDADCLILKVGTEAPAPYIHTVLTLWVTYPAKQEIIETDPETWWTKGENHIGNGPFILETLLENERAVFAPNPSYWEGEATYKIEFAYITDSAVAFEAYKNDEFDIIGLAAEDLATVEADATLNAEKYIFPGSCTFAVMFHHEKEPFSDPKIREAFAYATDRETWVTDVLNGLGSPTLTWIPPGFPGYDDSETRFGYDADAAMKAIEDSTYGSIDALPPIELTFSDSPRNRTRYEWLAAKWGEIFGIQITLNPVESTTYTALTKDRETAPMAYILGWCADYPDPQNWLPTYWKTGAFGERIAYSNPALDEIMAEADSTVDPTIRMGLYDEAQKMLVGSMPGAFMWNNVNSYLIKPYITGFKLTPQDTDWPGSQVPLSITVDKP